jgi:uncharacterized caspase-like protein
MKNTAYAVGLALALTSTPAWSAEKNAPVIELPAEVALEGDTVRLEGRIRDQSRIVFATLDGQPITVGPGGAIVLQKKVGSAASQLVVAALDEWGNRTEKAIRLVRPAALPKLSFGNYYALVIGNNDYAALPKLKTAVGDAQAVAALLKNAYGFETRILLNASRQQVIGAMAELRGKLKASDNLLLYYAGHGVLDSYAEEGFWLPVDAATDNPANWISNGDVTNMLRAIRAKHVMVVADSCYSGTLVRAAPVKIKTAEERSTWLERMAGKRSRTALVSGGLEPVMDAGGGGHSVFAKAFLESLSQNREVTDGQALFAAIKRPVALESDQTPAYSDIRRAGHDGGDFLFIRRGAGRQVASSAPAPRRAARAPAPAAAPPPDRSVELAFWNSIKDSKSAAEYQAYLSQYPNGAFAALARQRVQSLNRPKPQPQRQAAVRPRPAPVDPARALDGTWRARAVQLFGGDYCPTEIELEVTVRNRRVTGRGERITMTGRISVSDELEATIVSSDNSLFDVKATLKGREFRGQVTVGAMAHLDDPSNVGSGCDLRFTMRR